MILFSKAKNGVFYPLLAVLMPLSLLLAYILLIETLFSYNLPAVLLFTNGVLCALGAAFYCSFMKQKESNRAAADIRGGIIFTIISYLLTSVFLPEMPWPQRLLPNIINLFSVICTIYIWVNTITIWRLFDKRLFFEAFIEQHKGGNLHEALNDIPGLLQDIKQATDKTWLRHAVQLIIIAILSLICEALKLKIIIQLYLLLIILLTGGVCIYGFFEILKREQYYAYEETAVNIHDRTKHMLSVLILSLFGLTISFIFASDKNILPLFLVSGLFRWLFAWLFRLSYPVEPGTSTDDIIRDSMVSDFAIFQMEEPSSSPVWEMILKYGGIIFRYGFILLASFLFIRFMIAPLLKRNKTLKGTAIHRRLIKQITEWFKSVLAFIVSFIAYLKEKRLKENIIKYSRDEINKAAMNIIKAYSPAKKRDMQRSITLFAKLILWGTKTRNVAWKPSLGPGEYCAILAAAEPMHQQNAAIILCGELFEKALYSAETLSEDEQGEFKTFIKEIISNN